MRILDFGLRISNFVFTEPWVFRLNRSTIFKFQIRNPKFQIPNRQLAME